MMISFSAPRIRSCLLAIVFLTACSCSVSASMPPSHAERLSLLAATGLVLGFVTQPWHRVEPGWIAVLALAARDHP
jgi:hypothetical protein